MAAFVKLIPLLIELIPKIVSGIEKLIAFIQVKWEAFERSQKEKALAQAIQKSEIAKDTSDLDKLFGGGEKRASDLNSQPKP